MIGLRMSSETKVANHYGRDGLADAMVRAVDHLSKRPDELTPADLAPVDEFHVGGLVSTQELARHLELRAGVRVLDVGSGVGGPARYIATQFGCRVTGIDLTAEFVAAADRLTELLKLGHLVDFHHGSALQLPFADASFDRAYMIHVGMNIADKAGVFREVKRVLKPGALFMIFDVMRAGAGAMRFPVPWASSEEMSFVVDPQTYRSALEAAGFRIDKERSRREFAIEATEKNAAQMAKHSGPSAGVQILMGEEAPKMVANLLGMMKEGLLHPVELLASVAS